MKALTKQDLVNRKSYIIAKITKSAGVENLQRYMMLIVLWFWLSCFFMVVIFWSDGHGWFTEQSGQIIDWSMTRNLDSGDKIYFDTVVDSTGKVIRLYDIKP